jgi:glycosyltransferase involved in cell wall biosynthesis
VANGREKLLIIVNDLTGGGVERVAETNIRLMLECGDFDVAAATVAPVACVAGIEPGGGKETPAFSNFIFKNALKTKFSKVTGSLGMGFNAKNMESCLQRFRASVVHIHSYVHFSPAALKVLLAYKKQTGCKVVMTHHNFSYICPNDALFNYRTKTVCEKCVGSGRPFIVADRCYGSFAGSCGKYMQKRAFNKIFAAGLVDAHIAPSFFMRDKLLEKFPSLPVSVIHNPCLQDCSMRAKKKEPGKIVYFGRISREKNVAAAVRAVAQSKSSVQLLVVGDGACAAELESMIALRGAHGRVRFMRGFLAREQLYDAAGDAEYFILPSLWYENSPVAVIEALGMGMAPLLSNRGGMREILDWAGTGQGFEPESVDSIAQAIDRAVAASAAGRHCGAGAAKGAAGAAMREDAARPGGDLCRKTSLKDFTEPEYLRRIMRVYGARHAR